MQLSDKFLQIIKGNGDFVTKGVLPYLLPGLKIEEIGNISFPLSESESKLMIKAAKQAGNGQGLEIIVDASVRNVWKINASKIKFLNPERRSYPEKIKSRIAKGRHSIDN